MNRIVTLLCVPLVLALCAPGAAQQGEQKIIKIEAGLKNLTDEQKAAVKLAQDFLEKEKSTWGMPEKMWLEPATSDTIVGKGDQIYSIIYPTPDNEVKLISFRAVLVNVATKKAKFQPRK